MKHLKIPIKNRRASLLTAFGAIGVVVTALATAYSTVKAVRILDEEDEMAIKDKVNLLLPTYIPPIIFGAGTIACILSANTLNKRTIAALTSVCGMIGSSYNSYRNKLIELHGIEADVEIREAMARDCCDFHQIGLDVPDKKVIFYEEISGESVERYEREIMDAEYHLNRNFALHEYAPLNEFYEFLGLSQTDYGYELGWSMSYGYGWVDFEHRLISRDDGGQPIYAIDFVFAPDADYLREWE